MADPQKPDPHEPWCAKCLAHNNFYKANVGAFGEPSTIIYRCADCKDKMIVPFRRKKFGPSAALALIACFTVIVVGSFLLYDYMENSVPRNFFTNMVIPLMSVGICVSTFTGFLIYLPYYRWKKWAKERGWEEEKT